MLLRIIIVNNHNEVARRATSTQAEGTYNDNESVTIEELYNNYRNNVKYY